MALAPTISVNQLVKRYYDLYRENEITFSKETIRTLRMNPRQIYVKCDGGQWPCIINSASFQMAKIIIGTAGGAFQHIAKKDAPPVSLHFCFEDEGNPIFFFISCKVENITQYTTSNELVIVTLLYNQQPPDDFVLKIGTMLDADFNFIKRRAERITINETTQRALRLDKKESIVFIQGVPRRCILWDLSFLGAKIIIMGLPQFLQEKSSILRLVFSDPNEVVDIKGILVKCELVEGRKDLCSVGVKFDENLVPPAYKIRINEYLSTNKKTFIEASTVIQENAATEQGRITAQGGGIIKTK